LGHTARILELGRVQAGAPQITSVTFRRSYQ